ncbi:MAG: hypothetical protein LUG13_01655 [Oscillospiraceae bacterium]|nr:hypothetical protein [Oscillospiraceae bacterium]
MKDEEDHQADAPADRNPRKKKSSDKRNPVLLYLVILFAAAFLLLLMSYFMQQRNNAETISGLTDTSISAVQSLDNLISSRDALSEQVDALEDQMQALEEEVASLQKSLETAQADAVTLEKQVSAMDYLRRIQSFYNAGSYKSARIVIEAFQSSGLETFLPTQSTYQTEANSVRSPAEEYAKILEALY